MSEPDSSLMIGADIQSRETEARVSIRVRNQMPKPRVKVESDPEIEGKGQNGVTCNQGR